MRGRKVGCKLRCSAIEADSNFSVSLKIAGLGKIVGAKIVSELVRFYLSAMLSQKQHRLPAMVERWNYTWQSHKTHSVSQHQLVSSGLIYCCFASSRCSHRLTVVV